MVEYLDAEVVRRFTVRLSVLEPEDPLLDRIATRWLQLTMPDDEADRTILETSLQDVKASVADLEEARYVRREFDYEGGYERYTQLRSRLLERREAIKAALDELGPRAEPDLAILFDTVLSQEAWSDLTLHQQRSILALAVNKVKVGRSERRRVRLSDRVEIVWASEEDKDWE